MSPATKESLSPRMAHLLGFDDVYPALMDQLPARSSEGTRAKEGVYGE